MKPSLHVSHYDLVGSDAVPIRSVIPLLGCNAADLGRCIYCNNSAARGNFLEVNVIVCSCAYTSRSSLQKMAQLRVRLRGKQPPRPFPPIPRLSGLPRCRKRCSEYCTFCQHAGGRRQCCLRRGHCNGHPHPAPGHMCPQLLHHEWCHIAYPEHYILPEYL